MNKKIKNLFRHFLVLILFVGPTLIVGVSTIQETEIYPSIVESDPLVIEYSTFVGGNHNDEGGLVVIDSQNNPIYVGMTQSADFPVTIGPTSAVQDKDHVYIAKFNGQNLSEVIFFSTIGGNGRSRAHKIALDEEDNIYVAGGTSVLSNFATAGAYDTTHNGGGMDLFISKLASNGTLLFTTYFGGIGGEQAWDIALDSSNDIWIAGTTDSSNFHTTPDAFDDSYAWAPTEPLGMVAECFLAKFSNDGTSLLYSSYIGGDNGSEMLRAMEIDSSDNVYLVGATRADDFPVTSNAWDITHEEGIDGWVMKFGPDGSSLLWSSFVGGTENDYISSLALDSTDNIILGGFTESNDFPITENANQTSYQGHQDLFITKVAADGSQLIFSTYQGSSGYDFIWPLDIDENSSRIYFAGYTNGTDWPVTTGSYHGGTSDIIFGVLEDDGSEVLFSTYLGGTEEIIQAPPYFSDFPESIVVQNSTTVYMIVWTSSYDFYTTPDAYDSTYDNTPRSGLPLGGDAGLMKLVLPELPPKEVDPTEIPTEEESSTTTETQVETTTTTTTTTASFISLATFLPLLATLSYFYRKKTH
ncbi:MAG: hypothetical protein ACW98I_12035 [Candidatus Hodarchaeales archaeon]|jgi:hypothetical protein